MKAIKHRISKLMLVPSTLAITAAGALAEDPSTIWTTATGEITTAHTLLVAFLGALIVIPIAYFTYRLVTRGFGGR